jgi:translation initiation factor 1
MAHKDNPLLYSTDGSHLRACATCGRHPCVCPPAAALVPARTRLRLRLDTKGRRGKSVTVVDGLPPHPEGGADLLRQLKTHCGAGGTLKAGALELQGDQRDRAQAFLERLGFTVRRSGS